ncbi:PAS domain-containing hybrid sensor histidine kinase/response regulator [Magnetofaba australis]|uniref:Sensory/regulatory protein RpfC n=1 Tax=Magnetofaba australis IT-1 TaxID=1434232 RepID=A0A1Y2K025_9PROT|nr:PAS domain-containing hybrid sensor histidine kinase/response regulator [Magnetofaba australis]OSM01393.1 putative multi-sensor hybrid histidine kinase [Magnetofaba australis IT-1]
MSDKAHPLPAEPVIGRSIRFKLFFAAATALSVIIIGMTALSVWLTEQAIRQRLDATLTQRSALAAQILSNFLDAQIQLANDLGQLPQTRVFVNNTALRDALRPRLSTMMGEETANRPWILSVALSNHAQAHFRQTLTQDGYSEPQNPYWLNQAGQAQVTALPLKNGAPALAISQPVHGAGERERVTLLIDVERAQRYLFDAFNHTMDGFVAMAILPAQVGAITAPVSDHSPPGWISFKQAADQWDWSRDKPFRFGEAILHGQRLLRHPVGLISVTPAQVVEAPLRGMALGLVALGAAAILMGLLATARIANMIVAPLAALSRRALNAVRRMPTPSDVSANLSQLGAANEVMVLERILSLLLSRIATHTDELEVRLKERNEGLISANQQLRQEVIERRAAESALRAQQSLLSDILDASVAGVAMVDMEGGLTHCNARFARLWGFSEEEAASLPNHFLLRAVLMRARDAETMGKRLRELRPDQVLSGERIALESGRVLACYSMPIATGDKPGRLWQFLDITRESAHTATLERAKQQAEAANEAKSLFLATMSHEIRTPMNGVLGMVQRLARTDLTSAQREMANALEESADALMDLLNNILDLSKIEARQLVMESIPFEPRALVQSVLQMMVGLAQERGLTLNVEVSPTTPAWVMGDPTRVRQILLNLLGNAMKFTHHGGVSIHLEGLRHSPTQALLCMEVRDTGEGIDPAQAESLFEPFRQQDGSITRRFGGAGLGLAISRGLAQAMGGDLTAHARPEGGSIFRFEALFHLAQPVVTAHPAGVDVQGEGEQSMRRYKILVVEDDPINQAVTRGLLEDDGHTVWLAEHGERALTLFERHAPLDLVLMDLRMPGMDGYEATRRLRQLPYGDETLVVALTADALKESLERCLQAGMDDVLVKPVRVKRLRALMHKLLQEKSSSSNLAERVVTESDEAEHG